MYPHRTFESHQRCVDESAEFLLQSANTDGAILMLPYELQVLGQYVLECIEIY